MKRFIVEREIRGAAALSQDELAEIAKASNEVVANLGVPYNWVTTYVARSPPATAVDSDKVD